MQAIKIKNYPLLFFSTQIRVLLMSLVVTGTASARPDYYPGLRYENGISQSMGGVTVPLTDEIGNSLMNNPAGLAKGSSKFKAEFINLNLEANSNLLNTVGLNTLKMTSLSGMQSTLTSNPNQVFNMGGSNLTALSWGGLGVGLLFQERARAYSDGTNTYYQSVNQMIPTVGYGASFARGIVRVGYSLQYVNESVGTAQVPSTSTSASFLNNLNQGSSISHNASVNFALPFTYIPTFSLMGRNLFGLHYHSSVLYSQAKSPIGTPGDEPMTLDAAMSFNIRVSGSFKTNWYFQYKDMTSTTGMPFLERLSTGVEFVLSPSFSLRGGLTGSQFSAGLGFRSSSSEINLSWYHEQDPFSSISYWDTKYTLQYKLFFQDKSSRNRDQDSKGK